MYFILSGKYEEVYFKDNRKDHNFNNKYKKC